MGSRRAVLHDHDQLPQPGSVADAGAAGRRRRAGDGDDALLEPVRTTIWYGQINVFLMAIVLADLLRPDGAQAAARRRHRPDCGGSSSRRCCSRSICWVIRNTRAAVGVVAGFVGRCCLGSRSRRARRDYWTSKLRDPDRVGTPQTPGNQSIRGPLANLGHTNEPNGLLWILLVLVGFTPGDRRRGRGAPSRTGTARALAGGDDVVCHFADGPGDTIAWFVPLAVVALNWISDAGRSASRASSSESWSSAGSWRRSRGGRTWVTRHGSSTRRATMRT